MQEHDRQYWLWVTRPEYYLDDEGRDRQDLDPSGDSDADGWWTCHRETCRGDLILLWRTSPKRDIGYLIQARSNAYSISGDRYASKRGWDYGCDYRVLYKFAHPVTIHDLRDNAYLQDWAAYRAQFRRRVFRIPPEYWRMLNVLAATRNPGYREFIEDVQHEPLARSILLEEQLEDALVHNLGLLRKFGYDLELYVDPTTGAPGRQFVCRGMGGRIDLLCYDRGKKRYVVIELKNVRASQNTFGQVFSYVGWVQRNVAGRTSVIGLVISRGCDARFAVSRAATDRIFQVDIEDLGFQ